jgi:MFS family permease
MRLPTAMAPLRDRPFRLLFTGQAISLLGDGMAPVALAFAILDATGSASDLGWVLAARSGAMVALLLVGGVIADRMSRRLVMVVADLTRVAAQAATAALVLTGTAQLWELLVLQATFGAAMGLFYPALTGLVPATVRPEALQQANALRAIATSGGQVVGPALGGLVVAAAGPGWALVADALGFAVDAYFLARLPAIAVARTAGRFGRQLIEGWQAFTSRTWVWTVVVSASLGNMLFAPVMILGPVMAKQHLGGAVGWGIILAFIGIGSVAGGLLALRLRPAHPLRLGVLTVSLWSLPPLALAAGWPLWPVVAAALVGGAGQAIFNVLWETTLQRSVPSEMLSRVSSYDWFGSFVFQPVGQAIAGPVSGALGSPLTLLLSGAGVALTVLAIAVPSVRNLVSADPGSAASVPAEA